MKSIHIIFGITSVVTLLGLATASCHVPPPSASPATMESTMISLQGTIVRYMPRAMRDNYGPDGHKTFAMSEIALETTADSLPDSLHIYHDESQEIPGCWQTVGQKVAFAIAADDLRMSTIFRGALEDVVCE